MRKIQLISLVLILPSCVSKPITKPYSVVYEEAQKQGLNIPTAEEERVAFFKSDNENKERLIEVIGKRAKEKSVNEVYRIGPNDEVQINVFDVPELNLSAKVKESGLLDLPLVGTIDAKGKSEAELLKEVTGRLRNFVINPQVTLFISSYGSQKVAVVGAVRQPGTISLKKGNNTVLELIGEAGGLTEKAGTTINFVPKDENKNDPSIDAEAKARLALGVGTKNPLDAAKGVEVYLDSLMGTSGNIPVEVPVRGGDMIVIPEAGKIMVEGEVEKVGAYDLGRQMSLLGALAAAGGITYSAKVDEVEIIRDNGGDKRARLILDLQRISTGEERDIKLKNGDIVKIPSDSGKRMKYDTFEGITKLINFGVGGSVPLN